MRHGAWFFDNGWAMVLKLPHIDGGKVRVDRVQGWPPGDDGRIGVRFVNRVYATDLTIGVIAGRIRLSVDGAIPVAYATGGCICVPAGTSFTLEFEGDKYVTIEYTFSQTKDGPMPGVDTQSFASY